MSTKVAGIIAKVFQYAIGIIGAFFFVMILLKDENGGYISQAISLSQWSIYIAAGLAILFGVYHYLINIKHNIKSLIYLVVFFGIIFGSYMVAKGQPVNDKLLKEGMVTTNDLIMTDTGLYTFYALIVLAILTILISEVSRIFK